MQLWVFSSSCGGRDEQCWKDHILSINIITTHNKSHDNKWNVELSTQSALQRLWFFTPDRSTSCTHGMVGDKFFGRRRNGIGCNVEWFANDGSSLQFASRGGKCMFLHRLNPKKTFSSLQSDAGLVGNMRNVRFVTIELGGFLARILPSRGSFGGIASNRNEQRLHEVLPVSALFSSCSWIIWNNVGLSQLDTNKVSVLWDATKLKPGIRRLRKITACENPLLRLPSNKIWHLPVETAQVGQRRTWSHRRWTFRILVTTDSIRLE